MIKAMDAAAYLAQKYMSKYNEAIDEMKLHKLMYFAQRECLIATDAPLFDAVFYGWKYGPVLREIRSAYKNETFAPNIPDVLPKENVCILDAAFEKYSGKDSWSLSRLIHGELSWKNSRIGIGEYENSDNPMTLEDIRKDAERIKERRKNYLNWG